MASLCKLALIGNVGADPEQRFTADGNPVATFNVAANRRRRTADGQYQDETEWFRVSAMGRLAEIVTEYVSKGSRVYVDGNFTVDRWTAKDGSSRFTLQVFASELTLLNTKREAPAPAPAKGKKPTRDTDLEDLPF